MGKTFDFSSTTSLLSDIEKNTADFIEFTLKFLELSDMCIFRIDKKKKIIKLNKPFKDFFDLTDDDPNELTIEEYDKRFIYPDDYARIFKERLLKQSIDGAVYHYRIITKKGVVKHIVGKSFVTNEFRIGFISEIE